MEEQKYNEFDREVKDDVESVNLTDEEEEDDRDFPVAVILFTGLWTILFAIFTFGFDMDPDSCIVSNENDLIAEHIPFIDYVDPDNPSAVDVGVRFKFFFNCAFLMASGQLVVSIIGVLATTEISRLRVWLTCFFWLANLLTVVLWIYVFFVRYMHSGKLCSGDFIVHKK